MGQLGHLSGIAAIPALRNQLQVRKSSCNHFLNTRLDGSPIAPRPIAIMRNASLRLSIALGRTHRRRKKIANVETQAERTET
jgi:hypothetical protein